MGLKLVQALEKEVNAHFLELQSSKSSDQLLTNQIQRLIMCFDIYLEAPVDKMDAPGPIEFTKEKNFARAAR